MCNNQRPLLRFKKFKQPYTNLKNEKLFVERDEKAGNQKLNLLSVTIAEGIKKQEDINKKENLIADRSKYQIVHCNDICYNTMRLWQGAIGCSIYDGIVSPAYTVLRPLDMVNSRYVAYLFKTTKMLNTFTKYSQGMTSDNWNLKFDIFSTIQVNIPLLEEQKQVASFFSKIDEKLANLNKQLENIKKISSSLNIYLCLERIKFKDFNDEWEEKKLENYLKISKKKNKELMYNKFNVLTVSKEMGVVNQIEYKGKSLAGKSLSNYSILEKNNIVYTKSPVKDFPYGIIKINSGGDGIVSSLYAVYSAITDMCDPKFIDFYFSDILRTNKYLKKLVNIGAKNSMNISNSDFLKGLVKFPKLEEQRKIVCLYENLQKKIKIMNHKKQLLEQIKKGFMQQMFI